MISKVTQVINPIKNDSRHVHIGNERYYIMSIGDLEVGDEVVFEYLPKSKIILAINKIE